VFFKLACSYIFKSIFIRNTYLYVRTKPFPVNVRVIKISQGLKELRIGPITGNRHVFIQKKTP